MNSFRLKNILHTIALIGGMLLLLAAIGQLLGGSTGLVLAVAAGSLLVTFTQRVSPLFVLRLQGAQRLTPDQAPGLYRLVRQLSSRARLPAPPSLYLIQSPLTNALTVGNRREAAVALTSGVLNHLNEREIAGVLAHEISHIRNNDTQVMRFADTLNRITGLISTLGQVLLFFNLPLILMGRLPISWLAIVLLIGAPTISALLQLALSRSREYEADHQAALLTGDPTGLASALRKLEYYNTRSLRRWFLPGYRSPDSSLLRTHPHTEDRVRRLVEMPSRASNRAGTDMPLQFNRAFLR